MRIGIARPTSGRRRLYAALVLALTLALSACSATPEQSPTTTRENTTTLSLGSAFRTFHAYARPGTAAALVKSWLGTFGGSALPPVTTDLTLLPSKAEATMVFSSVAALSVYDFTTPIPFPFGQEVGA